MQPLREEEPLQDDDEGPPRLPFDPQQQDDVDQTATAATAAAKAKNGTAPTSSPSSSSSPFSIQEHLKTYTAGEDASRLQAAAKALGLQRARDPRRQVRRPNLKRKTSLSSGAVIAVWQALTDPTTEDARMLSVYSSHYFASAAVREDDRLLYGTLPELYEEEGVPLPPPLEVEEGEAAGEEEEEVLLGGSLTAAVLGIIKGMVGPAILYLPHGFAHAGYMVALPLMAVTTVCFLYSSKCLLDSYWKLQQQQQQHNEANDNNSNNKVGETTGLLSEQRPPQQQQHHHHRRRQVLSYPELAYRGLGTRGETVVKTGIALMQSGVCLTYLIFVPQNLNSVAKMVFADGTWMQQMSSPQIWLVVMVAMQIPLSWIRDIRKLTPTNLLANALILYGLLTLLLYALYTSMQGPSNRPMAEVWQHLQSLRPRDPDWFLFIGTSVLLFEGSITLLVPLQEAVHGERRRQQFPSVYNRVILCIIAFYVVFGLTCWMAFGHGVNVVLTTSLPPGLLAATVQLAYSIAVMFTFPLQNFPALEIACHSIKASIFPWKRESSSTNNSTKNHHQQMLSCWTQRNVISSFLVAFLAVIAVCTMDSLDKVVSLMGSLLGCPIAFVMPPLIHSSLASNTITPSRLWCNRLVAALGVVAMVLASATTLLTWK